MTGTTTGGRAPGRRRRGRAIAAAVASLVVGGCALAGPAPGGGEPARAGPAGPRETAPTSEGLAGVLASPSSYRALPNVEEVRALWVVRHTLRSPDSVRAMVRRADDAGFNTLIVQIRGRGDAFYCGGWEPPTDSVARPGGGCGFDPLRLVIEEAHRRGLGVHGWLNTHLVASAERLPEDRAHLYHARPDLLAVPRPLAGELFEMDPHDPAYRRALVEYARTHTDEVEGLYTIPAHPEVKEHVYTIWMDLLDRYALDGLHFDYVRFPGADFDYSRYALERFREWVLPWADPDGRRRLEEAWPDDPLAYVRAYPVMWDEFRRRQITGLVERIYYGVKKRRPEVVVSAAVFANAEDAYRNRFQDWTDWLRRGILDVAAPMAYTVEDAVFREQIRTAVRAAGDGRRVWAGIGAYRNTVSGTLAKIDIARGLGTGGISLFSYGSVVRGVDGDPGVLVLDALGGSAFGGGRRERP